MLLAITWPIIVLLGYPVVWVLLFLHLRKQDQPLKSLYQLMGIQIVAAAAVLYYFSDQSHIMEKFSNAILGVDMIGVFGMFWLYITWERAKTGSE